MTRKPDTMQLELRGHAGRRVSRVVDPPFRPIEPDVLPKDLEHSFAVHFTSNPEKQRNTTAEIAPYRNILPKSRSNAVIVRDSALHDTWGDHSWQDTSWLPPSCSAGRCLWPSSSSSSCCGQSTLPQTVSSFRKSSTTSTPRRSTCYGRGRPRPHTIIRFGSTPWVCATARSSQNPDRGFCAF